MDRFLGFCREEGKYVARRVGLVELAKVYLKVLKEDPNVPEWQWEQARQALRLFYQGTENWHWKVDEGGGLDRGSG